MALLDFGWDLGPLHFDYGHRVANFISFESREQFEPEADRLAARAAEEVRRLTSECDSLEKIAHILIERVERGSEGNATFHAGVAAGLIGQLVKAEQYFQIFEEKFGENKIRSAALWLKCPSRKYLNHCKAFAA